MKKTILSIFFTLFICSISYSQQWIIFFAYPANLPSTLGHTYVSFVKRDNATRQTVVEEVWGFFPVDTTYRALFKVEGELRKDTIWSHVLHAEYDFVVEIKDPKIYENCKKVKQSWLTKNYGVLAGQTCVTYAKDMASNIPGLSLPSNVNLLNKWPKDFLINLKELNMAIDKTSRYSLSAIPSKAEKTYEDILKPDFKNEEQYIIQYGKDKVKRLSEHEIEFTLTTGKKIVIKDSYDPATKNYDRNGIFIGYSDVMNSFILAVPNRGAGWLVLINRTTGFIRMFNMYYLIEGKWSADGKWLAYCDEGLNEEAYASMLIYSEKNIFKEQYNKDVTNWVAGEWKWLDNTTLEIKKMDTNLDKQKQIGTAYLVLQNGKWNMVNVKPAIKN